MASGTRKLEVIISGDAKGLDRAVGSAEKSIGGLDKTTTGFSKTASLGLAAVGVGALAMGKNFVDAASESQQVTRQTEAVLKSMGDQAGVTADDVASLADELSKKSGVDDEVIASGQNVLLTFGKVRNEVGAGNDIFTRATKAALDMSVALGTDLSSANIMLGKALNDPIKGMTALTRAGVSFTQQQKEQVAALVASGDTLGAQKIILQELDKQFAGSAEAQATASDKLAVAWGNLQEQIGSILLPAFEGIVDVGTKVLGVWESLPGPLQKIVAIGGTAGAGLLALGGAASFAIGHFRNMQQNLSGMIPSLSGVSGGLSRMGAALGAVGFVGAAFAAGKFAESITKSRIDVDKFTASLATADAAQQRGMGALLLVADRWGHLDSKIREAAESNLVGAQRMVDAAEAAGLSKDRLAELQAIIDETGAANVQGAVDQQTNTKAMQDATAAAQGLDMSLEEVANALRAQFDPLFAAQDATLRLKEAQDAAAQAAREHGAGSREAAAANDAAVRAAMAYDSALVGLKVAIDKGDVSLADAVATVQRWAREGKITADQAKQATDRFRELNAQADRMDGRVVTVTYREARAPRQSGAFGSATGGLVPQHLAAGGVGGIHPGFPKGTDTVPAWLTPGEFVVRRSAVQQVGTGFLEQVNKGQLPMMSRGGVVVHVDARGAVGLDPDGLAQAIRQTLERVFQRNGFALNF